MQASSSSFEHFSLQGCSALITGASSGLGEEFARQLAPMARHLVLVARREDRLLALKEALLKEYPQLAVFCYQVDLSSSKEREALLASVQKEKIPLNFLINNAGLGDVGPVAEASWEKLQQLLKVNIEGLTHMTHLFLPLLRHYSRSAILQVGSILAFFPMPQKSIYAATKAYVRSFSESLRIEEKAHRVTVSLLNPGPVPTEFFQVASQDIQPKGDSISQENQEDHAEALQNVIPSQLITSTQYVVSRALQGVVRGEASIIPNRFVHLLVALISSVPFWMVRFFLSRGFLGFKVKSRTHPN